MSVERKLSILVRLAHREEGSITVLGAVLLVGLIGVTSFAAELGSWYAARVELQRVADMAAIGGAFAYGVSSNSQLATNAAAEVAQLNGAAGVQAPSWNANSSTLIDGQITASIVPSPKTAGRNAVEVTITRPVTLLLTQLLSAAGTITLGAQAWAEITPGTSGGPACILALAHLGTGVVNGVTIGGNPTLDLNGCTLRSNSDVDVFGSAGVTALGVYAAGSIAGTSLITTTPSAGQLFNNAGVVADPYAGDAVLQSAFAQLSGGGSSVNVSPKGSAALTPGTYSSMTIKGTVTMAPGTYIVNGAISFGSQAQISGTGVTIISSSTVTINGGATVNLTAPLANAAVGVPGVVMASNSSSGSKINGGSSSAFQGALYFPNSNIEFTGNSANGGNGCAQVVAYTVTFKGSATLGSNCNGAGVATINSASNGVALVE